jgi:hypothetical protein
VNSVVRAQAPAGAYGDGSASPLRSGGYPDGAAREVMVQESLQALRVVTRLSLL